MARALRSYHDNVEVVSRDDLVEVDVESVCKHEDVTFLHVRSDLVLVNGCLQFVWCEDHNDIASFCSFFDIHYLETSSFSLSCMSGTRSETNNDVCAAFVQVHSVSVAL